MQQLKTLHENRLYNQALQKGIKLSPSELRKQYEETIFDTNVMMPLEVLADQTSLYCVMPYCDGWELFDWVSQRQTLGEGEARYFLSQILNGLETLQMAGICHRDISLENIITTKEGRLMIIDYGMCVKIPSFDPAGTSHILDQRTRRRCLIAPDKVCGKVSFSVLFPYSLFAFVIHVVEHYSHIRYSFYFSLD